MKPYAFIDRDGTLIVEKNYLADPAGVDLLPGAVEGLQSLTAQGYGLVLITNQAGVGRGYFAESDVRAVHGRLCLLLADHGLELNGIYYCPHAPDAGCPCRKPRTGLIDAACRDLPVERQRSVMIGDKASDIEAGTRSGMRALLVRTGYGNDHAADSACTPDAVVDDLLGAAKWLATHPYTEV